MGLKLHCFGKCSGASITLTIRPGLVVDSRYEWSVHLPVWVWRHVTGWYISWFGKIYDTSDVHQVPFADGSYTRRGGSVEV